MKIFHEHKDTINYSFSLIVIDSEDKRIPLSYLSSKSSNSGLTIEVTHIEELKQGEKLIPCVRCDNLDSLEHYTSQWGGNLFGIFGFDSHGTSLLEDPTIPDIYSMFEFRNYLADWEKFRQEGGDTRETNNSLNQAVRRYTRAWLREGWDGHAIYITYNEWLGLSNNSPVIVMGEEVGVWYAKLKNGQWVTHNTTEGILKACKSPLPEIVNEGDTREIDVD